MEKVPEVLFAIGRKGIVKSSSYRKGPRILRNPSFTANLEESRNVYHGVVEAVEAGPESDDDSVESAVEDSVSQYESVDFKRMSAYLAQLTEPKTASDRVELPPELECLQMGCEEAEQRALGDTFFGIDNVATAERNAR